MNIISNLWSGRSGLAKTYWLWGVLSGIPWGIALSLVKPGSNPAILAVLAVVVYYLIVHVGIWRAASQYQGRKAWAILAKIAVLITPACLVLGTMLAIALPAYQDYKKRSATIANNHSIAVQSESEGMKKKYLTDEEVGFGTSATAKAESEDQEILRKQGIGGNQNLFDVKSWGGEQLSARSFYGDDLIKAHSFAAMWQRQIIHKLKLSPERALFLGYSIVLNHIDQDNALCKPDIKKNGGIEDDEGDYLKTYPECYKK